ncbi:MAG: Smr/MutS family protein [Acidobacteria bacterium]|nr:Smr/MutS family protein [Acidobacteriota bacterium]
MPFSVGSSVVVVPLGRKRGVVVEVGRGGHYRVQVENTTVACRERDLAPPVPSKRQREGGPPEPRRKAARRDVRAAAAATDGDPPAPTPRLDLHGLTVEQALARVADEIDLALRRGADRIEVVHGKGSGRIRAALHRHLKTLPVVASFKLDSRNPGVTWIFF